MILIVKMWSSLQKSSRKNSFFIFQYSCQRFHGDCKKSWDWWIFDLYTCGYHGMNPFSWVKMALFPESMVAVRTWFIFWIHIGHSSIFWAVKRPSMDLNFWKFQHKLVFCVKIPLSYIMMKRNKIQSLFYPFNLPPHCAGWWFRMSKKDSSWKNLTKKFVFHLPVFLPEIDGFLALDKFSFQLTKSFLSCESDIA